MVRINANFFNIAQQSAKMAVHITNNKGGNFDWDIAMHFLKMAYYRCSVKEVECFIESMEKLTNADKKTR
ncbi:hypothetical protein [Escherichia coli]